MINPEKLVLSIYKKISFKTKFAFFSSIIISLITHLFYFTNHLLNHDGVNHLFGSIVSIDQGRWALEYATILNSHTDLSFVIGVACIFYIALTTCLTIKLLNIKSKLGILFVSMFLTVFPSISSLFLYRYGADGFMLGMFLSTLAVYLVHRYKYGFILGILVLILTTAIYQTYLSYFIGLSTLVLYKKILENPFSLKEWLLKVAKNIITALFGFILYMISVSLSLKISNTSLTSYKNINNMGKIDLSALPNQIVSLHLRLINFFYKGSFIKNNLFVEILYGIIFILICYFLIRKIINNRIYKDKIRMCLVIVVSLLFPTLISIIYLFGAASVHLIMLMSYVNIFLLLIVLMEPYLISKKEKSKINVISLYLACIALIFAAYNFYIVDNKIYLKVYTVYENSFAFANRFAMRLETFGEFSPDREVAIIGMIPNNNYPITKPWFSDVYNVTGLGKADYVYTSSTGKEIKNFLRDWIGLMVKQTSKENIQKIKETEEFLDMSLYPSENSIKLINGVVVVKMSEG